MTHYFYLICKDFPSFTVICHAHWVKLLQSPPTHLLDRFRPERFYQAGWWFDQETRQALWAPGAWPWGPGPRSPEDGSSGRRPPGCPAAARSSIPHSTLAPPPSPPARSCTSPSPPGWWCRGSGCRACPWFAVLLHGERWHWHEWAPIVDHRPDLSVTSSCTARQGQRLCVCVCVCEWVSVCPLMIVASLSRVSPQLIGIILFTLRHTPRAAQKISLQNFSKVHRASEGLPEVTFQTVHRTYVRLEPLHAIPKSNQCKPS